eukprot:Hpha_TRINITY_DN15496_c0_g13::TRINITY_DN15496_c0_g13_i1::g.173360::m.173360
MGAKVSHAGNDGQKDRLIQDSKLALKPSPAVWKTTDSGSSNLSWGGSLSEVPVEDEALMKLVMPPEAAESIYEFIGSTPGETPTQQSASPISFRTPSTPGDVHMSGFVG